MDQSPPTATNPTPNPTSETSSTIPQTWTGPFGLFAYSKRAVMKNVWAILALNILSIVVSSVDSINNYRHPDDFSPLSAVIILISIWLSIALIMVYLAGVRSEKMSAPEAVSRALGVYLKVLGGTILTSILLVLSFLALIIPGLFVLPRLALVTYYIADRRLGPIAAIKTSWRETKGHSLKIWSVTAATVLFGVLIFVIVGVYLLFIYQAAMAVLYALITRSAKAANATA